jgi:hypothetical protein
MKGLLQIIMGTIASFVSFTLLCSVPVASVEGFATILGHGGFITLKLLVIVSFALGFLCTIGLILWATKDYRDFRKRYKRQNYENKRRSFDRLLVITVCQQSPVNQHP